MNDVELTPATVDDIDEVLALRGQLARWLSSRGIDQWATPMPRDRLTEWLEDGAVHVFRDAGRAIGTVALLDRDEPVWGSDPAAACYVHLLMVDRAHAGHDLGGSILERAEAMARDRGADAIRLDAAADNSALQAWYEQRGYQAVGARAFLDGDVRFEVTLRQKQLTPPALLPGQGSDLAGSPDPTADNAEGPAT